jgi:hypothetical protein
MSTPETLGALSSTLGSAPVPVVNQALEPASVRDGSPTVQKDYDEALSFENVLVNQLCQQLVASTGIAGGSSADSSGSSSSGTSSSDPAVSDFTSMLPGALSSAIMADGGLGLAAQLLPSFESSSAAATGTSTTGDAAS